MNITYNNTTNADTYQQVNMVTNDAMVILENATKTFESQILSSLDLYAFKYNSSRECQFRSFSSDILCI